MSEPPLSSLAGHFINRASRLLLRRGEPRLRALGISAAQLPVLGTLKDGLPRTQASLAALIQVEQPTMAQLLSRMERDGLVERTPDPADRRSSFVSLTPAAKALLPKAHKELVRGNAEALKGFTDEERDTLVSLLEKVIANLDSPS
ncbi:DNA-binding MarR family transcriptional regulator [Luteibacter rhizovicinus]|uniref:DNA-binding MarR family transcriptional regulator n=1 Tax=Luteibacter rhizovicinus TaxID=242606 RepID=A0A4V6P415_9GAMM|nr:MarR family transcriptional regulator [Luteibacter rhizovicinus]TCV91179.1 DNA-binding MarR family transcriptional regulator [Luteibacter rhizovicinus]